MLPIFISWGRLKHVWLALSPMRTHNATKVTCLEEGFAWDDVTRKRTQCVGTLLIVGIQMMVFGARLSGVVRADLDVPSTTNQFTIPLDRQTLALEPA